MQPGGEQAERRPRLISRRGTSCWCSPAPARLFGAGEDCCPPGREAGSDHVTGAHCGCGRRSRARLWLLLLLLDPPASPLGWWPREARGPAVHSRDPWRGWGGPDTWAPLELHGHSAGVRGSKIETDSFPYFMGCIQQGRNSEETPKSST